LDANSSIFSIAKLRPDAIKKYEALRRQIPLTFCEFLPSAAFCSSIRGAPIVLFASKFHYANKCAIKLDSPQAFAAARGIPELSHRRQD